MNLSSSDVRLQIASFRSQSISYLFADSADSKSSGDSFADILAGKSSSLDTSGRNTSLFDPESGYQMMSVINRSEVQFKAQYAELNTMGNELQRLESAGNQLNEVDLTTANDDIKKRFETFSADYNRWIDRFKPDIDTGGVLDNVQAAEFSLSTLEQSVKNIFIGANDGFNGLDDIGIDVDPVTKHITIDNAKLDSALGSNKQGVVHALDDFSANFAKAADLLNQPDNMIPRQLDNRSRALAFIAGNRGSLQAEFGAGDRPTATGQVATALAAYEKTFGIA